LTDFDEILYVYSVGLKIGFFKFFGQIFSFFYDVALKNTYNPKFSPIDKIKYIQGVPEKVLELLTTFSATLTNTNIERKNV
jgi:hypothetical protein